jgi:hypothetical protein
VVINNGLALLPELVGDYNDNDVVDAADYVVWRNNVGTSTELPNDSLDGTIGTAQYNQWRTHFGQRLAAARRYPPPNRCRPSFSNRRHRYC